MSDQFRDADDRNRFELDVEGTTAFVTYRKSPGMITLVHTAVPPELASGRGLAQPFLDHTAHHSLSTFGRQGRILVAVHLVSPWNTEASQPQLPRFGPDGQPPERPHLAG